MPLYRLGFVLIGPVFASAQVLPAGTQQDPPKGSIEGRVLSVAGEPLRKAKLTLRPVADGPPSPSQSNVYTADTGADGAFIIHDLPPATYTLSAARVGYVIQVYGAKSPFVPTGQGTRLKLDAGQEMKALVIQLTPEGMIYGKVVDEDGDPAPGANIAVERWTYSNGTRQLRAANFGNSQADGSFVIGNLAPGRYVLSASFQSGYNGSTEIANGHLASNLTTFYPGVLDAASAAPLDITPGAALRGIEIRIRRGHAYEIRGHIQNTTSFPNPQGFAINLWTKGSDSFLPGMPRFDYVQGKAMTFQFKDLPAGTYIIQGRTQSAVGDERTIRLVGSIEVTIGDANKENAVLPLGTGIEIAGSIQTEGNAPASDSHPRVFLGSASAQPGYNSQTTEAESDGSFRFRGIMQGLYRVNVAGLPDGCYVKSTRFEGQDMTGKEMDLTAGHGGELQILVSPNAADVAGIVRNEKGDTVSSAMVQLFDDTRMKSSSSTDQNGAFHLKNLAPGEYKIFAWEDSSSGITQDAEFRKHFDPTVVKLAEKSHENIEMKLILKDAIEAETAKVQ